MPQVVRLVGLVAAILVAGSEGRATPMSYSLLGVSEATVFVNNGTTPLLEGGSFTTGLSGYVVIDEDAQTVESFSFNIDANTVLTFASGETYAGESSVTIESASIASSSPFTGSATPLLSGLFTFEGNTAEVNGVYSVGAGSIPISYPGSAIAFSVNSLSSIVVTAQSLGAIDGSAFGEPEPLNIASTLVMVLGSPVAIPEPGTAALLLVGLVGLAVSRR